MTLELYPLFPFLALGILALVAMLLSVLVSNATRVAYFSVAGLALVGVGSSAYGAHYPGGVARMFGGAVWIDSFSVFFYGLFVMIGIISILMAVPYLDRDQQNHGEYYTLILFALVGMFVMVSSNDLITLFLGFETMSLAVYTLTGYRRHVAASNEAILKYYFLGAFAAAIFLYGIALIYGTAHTVNLTLLHQLLLSPSLAAQPLMVLGALMVLLAVAFKVAAFPFHMWLPDVYQGAPTPATAFMATGVKAAAFALLLRLFFGLFASGDLHEIAVSVVWYLAVLTMFVGNVFALVQQNIKRLLAFSSIAHTGYLLVAVCALPDADAAAAIMFYLVGYAFTNLGALACVSWLQHREERLQNVEDFAGAAWRHPLAGLGMAVCMFSLIGFPPTAGFFGKYYLFLAAIKAGYVPLVIIAIINSILSVWYYLRVIVVMYMKPADEAETEQPTGWTGKVAIAYATVAVIWAGVGTVNLTALLPGAVPLLAHAKAAVATMNGPAAATATIPR
ncbi:MAG: nuoN [Cyanobacteria bacterium RYN_339]|nr:nuoN [Cyanobacteria bacterium RYN_339]